MRTGPFDESLCVSRDRSRWRTNYVLEDSVENRSGVRCQIAHELAEFAIEVAEKQQCLLTQHREARIVNRTDSIRVFEHLWHQWWKLPRERLCICRCL